MSFCHLSFVIVFFYDMHILIIYPLAAECLDLESTTPDLELPLPDQTSEFDDGNDADGNDAGMLPT